MHHLLLGS